MRITEVLLGLALLQGAAEHIATGARVLFGLRAVLAVLLIWGGFAPVVLGALCLHSLFVLRHFGGPYNGGSDKMGLLVLYCLTAAHLLPQGRGQEVAFAYLAVQLVLSYFISGQVKIANAEWRAGHALRDVFEFSAYPVSERMRELAAFPCLMRGASWAVIVFELAFPLSLLWTPALLVALVLAAGFHLANAVLFGLNRFVWAWAAAYPALIWFQGRVF